MRVPYGYVVCVDYADLLQITIVRMLLFVDKLVVVTCTRDKKTQELCAKYSDYVICHVTDKFYERGAVFNKGAAMEEALVKYPSPSWAVILDADIVIPTTFRPDFESFDKDTLYGCRRKIYKDVKGLTHVRDIKEHKLTPRGDKGIYGFFQLFHVGAESLKTRPWYGVNYIHAGGCDKEFMEKFPENKRKKLKDSVIHLGPPDKNWFGRSTPFTNGIEPSDAKEKLDLQKALFASKGWGVPKSGEFKETIE